MSALEPLVAALTAHDCNPTGSGAQFRARCPAHSDQGVSLSVSVDADGRILLACAEGCPAGEILFALGLCWENSGRAVKPIKDCNDVASLLSDARFREVTDRLMAEGRNAVPPWDRAIEPGTSADGRRLPSALLAFNVREDPLCLLGNRWLCRGGGAFLFAETGQGKSVLVMQAAILWALGKPLFGVAPKYRLKIALWQAENDDGDCAETIQGIVGELGLGAFAGELDERLRIEKETRYQGEELLRRIRPTLLGWKPDLVILDPLFSYLGGEINSAEDCGGFLRGLLNPLATECGNAWLIVHHDPKPSRKRDADATFNQAYAGHGSAELSNWCRASLTLRSTETGFELAANKRGKRAGLLDADGNPASSIPLRHSEKGICWLRDAVTFDLEKEEIEAAAKEVISSMPVTSSISRVEVRKLVEKIIGKTKKTVYQKGSRANKIWMRVLELTRDLHNPGYYRASHQSPASHIVVTGDRESHQSPSPVGGSDGDCVTGGLMAEAVGRCLSSAPDTDETVLAELDSTEWRSTATVTDRIRSRFPNTSSRACAAIVRAFAERHGLTDLRQIDGVKACSAFVARRVGQTLQFKLGSRPPDGTPEAGDSPKTKSRKKRSDPRNRMSPVQPPPPGDLPNSDGWKVPLPGAAAKESKP